MSHQKFYSKAHFYDLLFRFKDLAKENQTLIDLYQKLNDKMPASFLDIAAGPASNAIEMSKRGITSTAMDYSQEMVDYGLMRAKEEGATISYFQGDMRDFRSPKPVDLAAIFMISTSYLLTNDDMLQHLKSMASNLNPQGIYVLEMPHPIDLFAVGKHTLAQWEEKWEETWQERWEEYWEHQDGDTKVSLQWGEEADPFDPITQIRTVTARLKYQTPEETGEIVDHSAQREYTYQEMKLLIQISGVFELCCALGNWNTAIPFSNAKESSRMILVLRKL
ncbi:MAG: class I SAM-dependent methyltransferase [Proteobacteria bacterium]|nr:class I SAM-dependent methyltransferase [Pseudomonadota bacterium]